jgi:DNA end-binding protein Ku
VWSGAISFGLINIPVKLYSAISPKTVRFNQIDPSNNARIRTRKFNAETGEEVDGDTLVRGYELTKGNYVLVTDDELASLQPRATHTIDLQEFVELGEIDPIFYDGAYYVVPGQGGAKPYALLVEALTKADKVAVARFVMRSKLYVAAMRPTDGHLLLSMMVYADEINPVSEIPELEQLEQVDVTPKELEMAEALIDSLSAEFDPGRFHDTYRDELLELIHAKASGAVTSVEVPASPGDDVVVDLMAALEKSVAEAKEARKRHPTGKAPAPLDKPASARKAGAAAGTKKRAAAKKPVAARKSTEQKSPAQRKARTPKSA